MLDIQFIRDNPQLVKDKSDQKGYVVQVDQLLELDGHRRTRLTQIDELRARRNNQASAIQQGRPSEEQVTAGRQLKEELSHLESDLARIEEEYSTLLKAVPNMPLEDVPVGVSEDENVVCKEYGERGNFDFAVKTHWEIAEAKDWIDKVRATKIAGPRFAYIKRELVELQMAVMQFVIRTLGDENIIQKIVSDNELNVSTKPFIPVLPPAIVKTAPYEASARLNAAEVTYKLADDDAWLNASAEHSMCTMYMDEIIPEAKLPIRYIAYATSFRREAGTYGKDVEGIFRMHQFDKLEMEVFSTPESGLDEHKLLCALQEYLVQQLGLPYRVVQKCTADIGKPNATGVDLEIWLPGQDMYRETHTADYMTDYQSRRLKTRFRRENISAQAVTEISEPTLPIGFVHTNDATAFALGRIMIAIIENYQTKEGNVIVPPVLRPYLGGISQI